MTFHRCILSLIVLSAPSLGWATEPAATAAPPAQTLYAICQAHDYFLLEKRLANFDPSDPRRAFFDGQVAAAFRRDEAAEQALGSFLAVPGSDPDWRKAAWSSLGSVRLRRGEYGTAAQALAKAMNEPGTRFTTDERRDTEQTLAVARALDGTPALRRITNGAAATLPTHRDKAGLLNVEIHANGQAEQAVLDTGANFSCASATFAQKHGIRLLRDPVNVQAATGNTVPAQIGVANHLQIGRSEFEHVVFLVFQDKDLAFPQIDYAIHVIVGLPVILALEHLRFADDERTVEVGGLPSDTGGTPAARSLALDGLTPIVRVRYAGESLPFNLDTGAPQTSLTACFKQRFPTALAGASSHTIQQGGAGGAITSPVQMIPALTLGGDAVNVTLHAVTAVTGDVPPVPGVYGTIGRDFLAGGFELDFRQMRFSLLRAHEAK